MENNIFEQMAKRYATEDRMELRVNQKRTDKQIIRSWI